jgi:hypothetical protein
MYQQLKFSELKNLDKFFISADWCSINRIPMIKVGEFGFHIFTNGIKYPETYGVNPHLYVYKLPDDYELEKDKTVEFEPELTFSNLHIGDNFYLKDNGNQNQPLTRMKISPFHAVHFHQSSNRLIMVGVGSDIKIIKRCS